MRLGIPATPVALLLLTTVLTAPPALASGSVAYQGRLNDSGQPVNSSGDLRFTLWDAASDGSQVGAAVTRSNVDVVDGLFTVELDFGDGAFDGAARWIQVEVRTPHDPGNLAPFSVLDPRQPVAAAPYAIYALNAGQWRSAGDAITNTNAGFVGVNRENRLTNNEWFGVRAPVSTGYGGMYMSTDGPNSLPFYGYSTGADSAWHYLHGPTGDWRLFVKGDRLTVTDTGLVGVGTTTPETKLHVLGAGDGDVALFTHSGATGAAIHGVASAAAGFTHGLVAETFSTEGVGVTGAALAGTGDTVGGRFNANSPSGTGVDATGGLNGVLGTASNGSGETFGGLFRNHAPNGAGVAGIASDDSPSVSGVLGIGAAVGVRGEATAPGGIAVYAQATGSPGLGVVAEGTVGVTAVSTADTDGVGVVGISNSTSGTPRGVEGSVSSPIGYAGYFIGGRNYFEGNVGVGTTDPQHALHAVGEGSSNAVYGENSASGAGVFGHQMATTGIRNGVGGRSDSAAGRGVFGWATSVTGNAYGVYGQADSSTGAAVYGFATAPSGVTHGVRGAVNSASGFAGYFTGAVGSQNYFERSVGIGTTDPASMLSVAGGADITGQVSIGVTGADARLLVRGVTGEDAFRVRVEGATKFLVKDNGGVGIGSNFASLPADGLRTVGAVGIGADPGAFKLAVNGDAAKPGGGLWSVFSDARLKHDLRPLEPGALDRLLSLHGWTFEYNAEAVAEGLSLPGRQTGLVAQEVQAVFPNWVDADAKGRLYVTERGLTAIVVEALRELRCEKDAEIESLRSELESLTRRLDAIEANQTR